MNWVYPSRHVNLPLIVEIKSRNFPKLTKVNFQNYQQNPCFSSKFGVSNTKYESTGGGRMNKWPWPAQTLKTSFAAGGRFRRENKARILMTSQETGPALQQITVFLNEIQVGGKSTKTVRTSNRIITCFSTSLFPSYRGRERNLQMGAKDKEKVQQMEGGRGQIASKWFHNNLLWRCRKGLKAGSVQPYQGKVNTLFSSSIQQENCCWGSLRYSLNHF